MKFYEASYKMRNPRYPDQITFLLEWASETIEARGIVHAAKLAKAHLIELRKIAPGEVEIEYVREIQEEAEAL